MSSLIRLVSAALEKPQAPCGREGTGREASVTKGADQSGPSAAPWQKSNCSLPGSAGMVQEEREQTRSRLTHLTFQPFDETSTP